MRINAKGLCKKCKIDKYKWNAKNKMLPLWYKDPVNEKRPMYGLPLALKNLRIGEQLLIQMAAPYVPVYHLKKGQTGIKGHVCSFAQNVEEVYDRLPRMPEDITLVKMVRAIKRKDDDDIQVRSFYIRRKKVLDALIWLKKYNKHYMQITIDEKNLDWMGKSKESDLCDVIDISTSVEIPDDLPSYMDQGPASNQCLDPLEENSAIDDNCCGILVGKNTPHMSKHDAAVLKELKSAADKNQSVERMEWPSISSQPFCEYKEEHLFCKAFPWLFPGGYGDYNETRIKQVHAGDWAQQMLYYYDGRFARDKIWCFFALNYCSRRRNQKSGNFFIKSFLRQMPQTLDELKESIEAGDTKYIDQLTYFSHHVRGSNSYWRAKRSELYSWINYHIDQGHGGPTIFMTLSCAEYFWPDIIRLLENRIWIAENRCVDLSKNIAERNRAVLEYSLVIQEYFQVRVQEFMNTVGKHVFGIEHYWLRYEFAKSRGQIHAHILAICKDGKNIQKKCLKKNTMLTSKQRYLQLGQKIALEWLLVTLQ